MHKLLSGAAILVLALLLVVFTSAHTVSFISTSIPGDNQIMAYAGLAAFDGGLILWLYAALFNAVSEAQKSVAWVMVFVSMAGVFAAYAIDSFLVASRRGLSGKVDQGTVDTVIWVTVIVVCLNVLSTVLYHAFDPRARLRSARAKADAELAHQEAEIEIAMKQAELRHLRENSGFIGEELARMKARDWVERQRRKASEEISDIPESRRGPVIEPIAVKTLPQSDQRRNVTNVTKKRTVAPIVPERNYARWLVQNGKAESETPERAAKINKVMDRFKSSGVGGTMVDTGEAEPDAFLSQQPEPANRTIKVQGKMMNALRSRQDNSSKPKKAKE